MKAALTARGGLLLTLTTVLLLWLALPGGGGFQPLLAVACVPLFVCIFRGSGRQALAFGFLAGVGHFLLQVYWIVFVLGHYGGFPLFLSVPALLLLVIYMAVYVMAFSWLANLFVHRFPVSLSLWLLPCAWVGMDWLRSFLFSGFPWMDLGYGLAGIPVLLQSADIWGHYGLTFLVVLVNTLLALFVVNRGGKKVTIGMVTPVALLLVLVAAYSAGRWQQLESGKQETESLTVAVIQGNVDQSQKWLPERQQETVKNYIEQSGRAMMNTSRPQLLVWPETALPFYPIAHPLLEPVQRFVSREQVMLLTGAPWYERNRGDGKGWSFLTAVFFSTIRASLLPVPPKPILSLLASMCR